MGRDRDHSSVSDDSDSGSEQDTGKHRNSYDNACDQFLDAVLNPCLNTNSEGKTACETAMTDIIATVAGRITTQAKIVYVKVVLGVIVMISFDQFADDLSSVGNNGLSDKTCDPLAHVNKHRASIADKLHVDADNVDVSITTNTSCLSMQAMRRGTA